MKDFLRETDEFFARFMPSVTRKVFYLNVFVFLTVAILLALFRQTGVSIVDRALMLTPSQAVLGGHVWQFVTYMFSHISGWHLFGNMLGLFFFGKLIEDRMGGRAYLGFLLLAGVVGGVAHTIIAFATGNSGVSLLGFSGAVFAILTAAIMWYPRKVIYVNFLFPMPLRVMAVFYGVLMALSIFSDLQEHGLMGGRISHTAHLAGIFSAIVMLKFPRILETWENIRFPWERRRPRKVASRGGFGMKHPGRHSDPDDLYDDPHWKLDQ